MNLLRNTTERSEYPRDSVKGSGAVHGANDRDLPRILMVGMDLTRTRGGITTLTRDILASSVAAEFDITYIASQAEDLGVFGKALLATRALAKFLIKCVSSGPDLVYVHVGSNASLYRESLFIVLARILGKRVLGHFHAGDIVEYFQRQPRFGQGMIRFGLGRAQRWIAVSLASAAMLKQISGARDVTVIENGIDMSDFVHRGTKDQNDVLKLLFVGAVGKLKGERDLVEALALVKARGFDFRASFLGYGADSLADQLAAAGLSKRIDHLGPVPTEERVEHFLNADIFVLPTYAEAMPVSVIEAMAAGNAIVTTPVGGIPEVVDDGETALFFSPGNPHELADRIAVLLSDSELRRRLGANARKRALRDLDIRKYEDRLSKEIVRSLHAAERVPLKLIAKRAVKSAAAFTTAIRSRRAAAGVRVLAYHRVVSDLSAAERDAYYGLVVSTETFRKHCEILADEFEVMSLESAAEALQDGTVGERPIAVITFDDGYRDNYDEAFPVLREMGLPATVFVPTGWIGSGKPLAHDRLFWLLSTAQKREMSLETAVLSVGLGPDLAGRFRTVNNSLELTESLVHLPHLIRERLIREIESAIGDAPPYPDEYALLDWDMVHEMARNRVTFGGHTVNHTVLTLEDEEAARNEISGCAADLRRELGTDCTTFAYPNGEFDPRIRSQVAAAGFTAAVTTKRRVNVPGNDHDLLALGRISLCEESTRGSSGRYSEAVARLRLSM